MGVKVEEGKLRVPLSELKQLKWNSWMSLLSKIFNCVLHLLEATSSNAVCIRDAIFAICPEAKREPALAVVTKSPVRQPSPAPVPVASGPETFDTEDSGGLDDLEEPNFESLGLLDETHADLSCLDKAPEPPKPVTVEEADASDQTSTEPGESDSGLDVRVCSEAARLGKDITGDLCEQIHLRISRLIGKRNKGSSDSEMPLARYIAVFRKP